MIERFDLSDTSPAIAGTVASAVAPAQGLDECELVTAFLTLQGATGGTLVVTLQRSNDGGATYWDWFRSSTLAAGAAATSLCFAQILNGSATPVAIGKGVTPALAANTVAPGSCGKLIRVLFEAGAGTSAGALQTIILEGYRSLRRE